MRQRFFHSIAPGGLAGDRRGAVPASGFSFSAQQIWKVIKENKDLDLPAHKVILWTRGHLWHVHVLVYLMQDPSIVGHGGYCTLWRNCQRKVCLFCCKWGTCCSYNLVILFPICLIFNFISLANIINYQHPNCIKWPQDWCHLEEAVQSGPISGFGKKLSSILDSFLSE